LKVGARPVHFPSISGLIRVSMTSARIAAKRMFRRLDQGVSHCWIRPAEALWPRWIWLRALGLIFLSAFYSLAFQITGLLGPRGILPAADYLVAVRQAVGMPKALWFAPTLFWISARMER
jgi:hypothetical protein